MRTLLRQITVCTALCLAGAAYAQAPAGAPAGTTGLCKDGTYSTSAAKKGACRGHKGVKEWYAAAEEKGGAAPAKSESATAAKPAAAAPATATPAAEKKAAAPATAAAGGGPGKVWVNTSSKVYHCPNDKWYGKTKEGQYMTEAEAKAGGYRAERGKACQ